MFHSPQGWVLQIRASILVPEQSPFTGHDRSLVLIPDPQNELQEDQFSQADQVS